MKKTTEQKQEHNYKQIVIRNEVKDFFGNTYDRDNYKLYKGKVLINWERNHVRYIDFLVRLEEIGITEEEVLEVIIKEEILEERKEQNENN